MKDAYLALCFVLLKKHLFYFILFFSSNFYLFGSCFRTASGHPFFFFFFFFTNDNINSVCSHVQIARLKITYLVLDQMSNILSLFVEFYF